MRQVIVQAPQGAGHRVLDAAKRCGGTNLSLASATDGDGNPIDLIAVHLPNTNVGPFLGAVESLADLRLTLLPMGVLPLGPPATQVAPEVARVQHRSSIEVFLSGLQSIGSWRGFLGYAAVAGTVVWLGLFTTTSYLLVAAMLIAPFAGPAMNAAVATARGDLPLLWHALARYVAALTVAIVTAGLLSLIFRQEAATQQMAAVANISAAAVVLPLAAGMAGALNLCQSERSSLVSGAAVGMLVAASLAPPAGLIGMAAVTSDGAMVRSGLFLLALQLLGINLAGAAIFRLYGVGPEGVRYHRGHPWVARASAVVSLAGLGALLIWQFGTAPPLLQRATLAERLRAVVVETIDRRNDVALAEAEVAFTRAQIPGQQTVLVRVDLQPRGGQGTSDEALRQEITRAVQQAIEAQDPRLTALVDVAILHPPPGPPGR